jgi:two-component system, NarL family, nitrate/nitrite response regulator NarL
MTFGEATSAPEALIGSGAPLPILVAATSPALRAGLAALLAQDPGLQPVVAPAMSPTPLEATAPPAAIVADLSPGGSLADDLAEAWPGVPLVLVGGDPAVDGPGLAEGPVAYLAADADGPTLIAAARAVIAGLTVIDPAVANVAGLHVHARRDGQGDAGEPISARERQVLELVAAGLPNKAIARELGISEHTVKFHVGSLLDKLGAASRTEAVTLATRRGILAI